MNGTTAGDWTSHMTAPRTTKQAASGTIHQRLFRATKMNNSFTPLPPNREADNTTRSRLPVSAHLQTFRIRQDKIPTWK